MNNDISRQVQIGAPIEQVFEFLTNPVKIPLVLPGLIENTSIPKLPLKKGAKFKFKFQMFGVILKGAWTALDIKKPTTYSAKTDGEVKSQWHYTLAKKGTGTLLTVHIKYETPKSVLAKVKASAVHSMNKKEIEHFCHNLKTVLELKR